jgi:hypothetical protein
MPDGDTTALVIARQLARPAATALGLQTDHHSPDRKPEAEVDSEEPSDDFLSLHA